MKQKAVSQLTHIHNIVDEVRWIARRKILPFNYATMVISPVGLAADFCWNKSLWDRTIYRYRKQNACVPSPNWPLWSRAFVVAVFFSVAACRYSSEFWMGLWLKYLTVRRSTTPNCISGSRKSSTTENAINGSNRLCGRFDLLLGASVSSCCFGDAIAVVVPVIFCTM